MPYETSTERLARLKAQGICRRCERQRIEGLDKSCARCRREIEKLWQDSLRPCVRCGKPVAPTAIEPCGNCREAEAMARCSGYRSRDMRQAPFSVPETIFAAWRCRAPCRSCENLQITQTGRYDHVSGYRKSCQLGFEVDSNDKLGDS